MSEQLKQKIGRLISEGKFDEVKKLVSGMLAGDLTDEERGAVLAGIALAHMEAENAARAVYRDALADAVEDAEQIGRAEKALDEQTKIDMVRADLN
jgi:hypothetical protein